MNLDDESVGCTPGLVQALWREWVGVVCEQRGMEPPTHSEWMVLESEWHEGTAPIDSVEWLRVMRSKP